MMNRPTFFHGVVVALAISIGGAAVLATFEPIAGTDTALRAVIPAMGLAYLFYLLRSSAETIGRITTLAVWFVVSAATWFLAPSIAVSLLIHAALLWLARSLYFHSGFLSALLDFGITALSVCAAIWALSRSGSFFLAAWCFFLMQALFVLVPARIGARPGKFVGHGLPEQDEDAFERARERADTALRQLFTQ